MWDDLELLDAIDPDRVENYRHGTLVVIFTGLQVEAKEGKILIGWHRFVQPLNTRKDP